MTELGHAWLGDYGERCLSRARWEGRVTSVRTPTPAVGWWFTATMIACDGSGSVYSDEFSVSDIREADRGSVRVGAVVKTLTEEMAGRTTDTRRFAVRVLADPDERGLWEKT